MAKQLDAAVIAAEWRDRLSASGDKIKRGVMAVTVAPGAAAARQADVWATNTLASKARFARNVGKIGIAEWQNDMTTKGIDRIPGGAAAAVG